MTGPDSTRCLKAAQHVGRQQPEATRSMLQSALHLRACATSTWFRLCLLPACCAQSSSRWPTYCALQQIC